MPIPVSITLDLAVPSQAALFETWRALHSNYRAAVESLRSTQTFSDFLRPLATVINSDQEYTAEQLGQLFTPPLVPRQISSAVAKIGKTEKRLQQRVIQRRKTTTGDVYYRMLPEVREAILS